MIAQVFDRSPGADRRQEMRKFAEDAMGQGRKMDGNEGTISLIDPTTGKGLVINLFP